MGLSGEPGTGGKWKERMKKIEVGMVQIGLGHNYKVIYFLCKSFKTANKMNVHIHVIIVWCLQNIICVHKLEYIFMDIRTIVTY